MAREMLVKDNESVWVNDIFAYDLESLEPVDPRNFTPEPDSQSARNLGPSGGSQPFGRYVHKIPSDSNASVGDKVASQEVRWRGHHGLKGVDSDDQSAHW